MSTSLSFYLVTFLNAGSIFGRLGAGAFGVFAGQFNVLALCACICAIMIWSWLAIDSNAGIIVFSVFYGAFSGGAISTMIATLASCAPNPNQMGTYIGMASAFLGVAGLTGTPINGALVSKYGGYNEAIYFSAACATFGAIVLIGARMAFAPLSKWRA
jgi:MFS family permease